MSKDLPCNFCIHKLVCKFVNSFNTVALNIDDYLKASYIDDGIHFTIKCDYFHPDLVNKE